MYMYRLGGRVPEPQQQAHADIPRAMPCTEACPTDLDHRSDSEAVDGLRAVTMLAGADPDEPDACQLPLGKKCSRPDTSTALEKDGTPARASSV